MKLSYDYVLTDEEITVQEEKADMVHNVFGTYLAEASLGKIVDLPARKEIVSPTGKAKWTRAAVDKLLVSKEYVPMVGIEVYMDAQFERARRCNIGYKKAGHFGEIIKYQAPPFIAWRDYI